MDVYLRLLNHHVEPHLVENVYLVKSLDLCWRKPNLESDLILIVASLHTLHLLVRINVSGHVVDNLCHLWTEWFLEELIKTLQVRFVLVMFKDKVKV